MRDIAPFVVKPEKASFSGFLPFGEMRGKAGREPRAGRGTGEALTININC
jgi:hypothetical protein